MLNDINKKILLFQCLVIINTAPLIFPFFVDDRVRDIFVTSGEVS